jgi:hypothetical protein
MEMFDGEKGLLLLKRRTIFLITKTGLEQSFRGGVIGRVLSCRRDQMITEQKKFQLVNPDHIELVTLEDRVEERVVRIVKTD